MEFASEKANCACLFALLIHVAAREFFFDFDCLFFGTAIFNKNII